MVWTNQLPTQEGHYWWRYAPEEKSPSVFYVYWNEDGGGLEMDGRWVNGIRTEYPTCEWCLIDGPREEAQG